MYFSLEFARLSSRGTLNLLTSLREELDEKLSHSQSENVTKILEPYKNYV